MNTLAEKLHPHQFTVTEMSPQMAAIVAYIVGKPWTTPEIDDLVILPDGLVAAYVHPGGPTILGYVVDLDRNISELLTAAGLTEEERSEWQRLYNLMVTDWRKAPYWRVK